MDSIDGRYIEEEEHYEKILPQLQLIKDEEPTMSDYAEASMKAKKILVETKLSIAALERELADSFERLRS